MVWQTIDALKAKLEANFASKLVTLSNSQKVAWRETLPADNQQTTIVLLHGISSGAASWLELALNMVQIKPNIRILAWDMPGYGNSSAIAKNNINIDDYAASLKQSLDELKVKNCILVGHSLGALIAAYAACNQLKDLTQKLVLLSPAGGYGGIDNLEQQNKVRNLRLNALQELGIEGLAANVDQRLASPFASDLARQWLRFNAQQMHEKGYMQAIELLCTSDLGINVGKFNLPIYVLVGADDEITKPESCANWAWQFNAEFEVIVNAGHALPVEQPLVMAQKIGNII